MNIKSIAKIDFEEANKICKYFYFYLILQGLIYNSGLFVLAVNRGQSFAFNLHSI